MLEFLHLVFSSVIYSVSRGIVMGSSFVHYHLGLNTNAVKVMNILHTQKIQQMQTKIVPLCYTVMNTGIGWHLTLSMIQAILSQIYTRKSRTIYYLTCREMREGLLSSPPPHFLKKVDTHLLVSYTHWRSAWAVTDVEIYQGQK